MFIDLQQVPPEGQTVECDFSADNLAFGKDLCLIDRIRISGRLGPLDEGAFCLMGRMSATVEMGCVRCLETFAMGLDEELELLFLPQSANVGSGVKDEERELTEDELTVSFYRNDRIDLSQTVWEQVHLALPMKPLCVEDCRGLCQECGANLNLAQCSCVRETVDPRLANLKTLLKS